VEVMKNYEEIQIKLDLVLDEKSQKDVNLIIESFRAIEQEGKYPFADCTREDILATALKAGISNYISQQADYFSVLLEKD